MHGGMELLDLLLNQTDNIQPWPVTIHGVRKNYLEKHLFVPVDIITAITNLTEALYDNCLAIYLYCFVGVWGIISLQFYFTPCVRHRD